MSRSIAPAIHAVAITVCTIASWSLCPASDAGKSERPRNDPQDRSLPETAEELLERFESAATFWQQAEVARALVARGDATIIPKIVRHLDVADRRRRCNAGLVLAGLSDERGLAIIVGELQDRSPRPTELIRSDGKADPERQVREDRYYAALLLGQLREKAAVPALLEATADSTINYQAAISLGEIGDKRAIPGLRKMAEEFPSQKLWAGYGLAALGEPEGFELLAEAAHSGLWTDRRHAVEALGKIGDSRAVPTVIKALHDKHVNVRVSAAVALGQIGDAAALPALTEALDDSDTTHINAPTTVANEARKAIEAIQKKQK